MALTHEQAVALGRRGGSKHNPRKGFGTNKKLASLAGFKGGSLSKRHKPVVQ